MFKAISLIVLLSLLPFVYAVDKAQLTQARVNESANMIASTGMSDGTESVASIPNMAKSSLANQTAAKPILPINKIVVFVNKGIITEAQIDDQVAQIINQFKQKGAELPSESAVRPQVLQQLIMQQIQLDLAKRDGIKTTDSEVNDAIANVAKAQNMTPDQLKAAALKQGISDADLKKQILMQITLEKLKQREVDSRVFVNEDEVNRVLNSDAYKNKVDYNLSNILISISEQPTSDVVQAKEALANQAYTDLIAGKNFSQVAVKYSNGPNALNGGELGWRSSATLPPIIAMALANLKVGEVTRPIHLPMGFFIFKLNDIKKHGVPQVVKQYHVRHILIKVNEITSDVEAHQRILMIKQQLDQDKNNPAKLNQDFIRLAKKFSEDTSSINGGDLGWISKGDTVPQFEQAVLSTPIGQVSDPIRSPFGWHLVEVLETRDSNLTNDREKAEIRQELHDTKASLMYQQWLRDIREMAYVKINDN